MPVLPRTTESSTAPRRRSATTATLSVVVLVASLLAVAGVSSSTASPAPTTGPLLVGTQVDSPGTTPAQLRRDLRGALSRADAGKRIPRRTTPSYSDFGQDTVVIDEGCAADIEESRHRVCSFGDVDGERTVVLLGSSHATMWLNGLEGPAADSGVRLVGLFKYGCSPLVTSTYLKSQAWPECSQWRRWALRQVARIAPDQVVIGTHSYASIQSKRGKRLEEGSPAYERAYARGLRRLVTKLTASSDDVVMLGDLARRPNATRPLLCLERENRRMKPCENRLDRRTRAILARDRKATLAAGGRFYDSNRLTCLTRRCPVVADGKFVYRDFSHVTRTWSVHSGPVLARGVGLAG